MLENQNIVVDGHDEVETMLLQLVEVVRGNPKICLGGVVLCDGPVGYGKWWAGAMGCEYALQAGLDDLYDVIKAKVRARQIQKFNTTASADHVVLNMAKLMANFDLVPWLISSEMTRVREDAPAPLKVAYFWGDSIPANQRDNFEGIVRPLISLIGAVEVEGTDGRVIESCSMAPVIAAFKNGEAIPQFRAPADVQKSVMDYTLQQFGKLPVTITLREADHWPHRNSNLTEWLKFAEWLEHRGEKVLFIRDTAKANEKITHYMTCPQASENLIARCAVYQAAKCNLFVSNGPAMLALFMDRPWLMFNEVQDDGPYHANTTAGWQKLMGITPPAQFPWCRDDQKIIWQRDTFEVMRDAWLETMQDSEGEQAAA